MPGLYHPVVAAVTKAYRCLLQGNGFVEFNGEDDAVASRESHPTLAIVASNAQTAVVECFGEACGILFAGAVFGFEGVAVCFDRDMSHAVQLTVGHLLAQLGRRVEIVPTVLPEIDAVGCQLGHYHKTEMLNTVATDAEA